MKQLGIIINKVSDERLEGSLVDTGVSVSIDDSGCIKATEKIKHTHFVLILGAKKTLKFEAGVNSIDAHRVGHALMSIGYEDLTMVFNGIECEINNDDEP